MLWGSDSNYGGGGTKSLQKRVVGLDHVSLLELQVGPLPF